MQDSPLLSKTKTSVVTGVSHPHPADSQPAGELHVTEARLDPRLHLTALLPPPPPQSIRVQRPIEQH
ncbi:hypothetical protein chiPu_0023207 [Chiloscyllium punctatum]|uniref:Uncharacterized protein n=1 Tax=Chiloscyllium punctatum TaxID=137246 RepID=A0A401T9F6_CHIPU|nr:hypothetical protein [Chiloscyllium punctatum]